MQKINFSIMLFYYSAFAFVITLALIVGESRVKDQAIRLFRYSGEQWLFTMLASLVNFVGLCYQTIAL